MAPGEEMAPGCTLARAIEAERLDTTGHIRQRAQQADEFFDLLFGSELSSREHLGEVRIREVRSELQESSEMELSSLDRAEEQWKALHEPSRGDAPIGSVLGHPKFINAIGVNARAGASAMDPARLDLGQVCEQRSEDAIRLADEPPRSREQVDIRERFHGYASGRSARIVRRAATPIRAITPVILHPRSLFVRVHARTLHPDSGSF